MFAAILELLSSLEIWLPSGRNIPLMLTRLSASARGLSSLLRRIVSHMRARAYTFRTARDVNTYRASGILWTRNNLASAYAPGFVM